MVVQWVERWTCDQQVVGSNLTRTKAALQPLASRSLLCASVTKQYNLVPAKEQWWSAAGKVTTGLAESTGNLHLSVWLMVTYGLTACTLGSAQGPMLGNEYGKPFLPFIIQKLPDAVHVDWWSRLVFSLRITHKTNLSIHVKSMESRTSFDKWPAKTKLCYRTSADKSSNWYHLTICPYTLNMI